jgi:molecular chaperone DnaK
VEVSFDIDANGIVNVAAKDMATGQEQKITISGASGLSKDDVDRMVKEAKSHASEDAKRRDLIDARNQADSLAYSVEKTVNESRDRLPATDVNRVEAAIAALREAAAGDHLEVIRRASDDLQKASHAMAEQLYKQSQTNAANAAAPQNKDDDVKDGEVVDA